MIENKHYLLVTHLKFFVKGSNSTVSNEQININSFVIANNLS